MRSYAGKFIEGKKYSQDDLIAIIILFLGGNGGRDTKQHVEERAYELFREDFKKDFCHEKVANGNVPRWKHDIAWARERAKQNHGYIKPAGESGRGLWELTTKGKTYFDQLVKTLKNVQNEEKQ
jgi:hypothetical protein